ncbi:hypothetical protein [Escherichia coli]
MARRVGKSLSFTNWVELLDNVWGNYLNIKHYK